MEAFDIVIWVLAIAIFIGLFLTKSKKQYGIRRKEDREKDDQAPPSMFSGRK